MTVTSVLVLAGSTEAAELAAILHDEPGIAVTASYAGRVRQLRPLPCPVRVGGFGGAAGLAEFLQTAGHDLLVDATHPFAARMSANAATAAAATGIPRLRLRREPWHPGTGDDWQEVDNLDEAAACVGRLGARRAFLATGRHDLAPFSALTGVELTLRSIDPPAEPPPPGVTFVQDRGPFRVEDEIVLLSRIGAEVVVTRNSGGTGAAAKLEAARQLGLPVILVRPPPPPPGPTVGTVPEALDWVRGHADTQPAG